MNVIKKYRNEWKYCCTIHDLNIMGRRLEALLERDQHCVQNGKYEVHSLYFDDYKNNAVKKNDAGISERMKYRIRYYGNQYESMRLERKEKAAGYCYKENCLLSMEEYQKIMEGNTEEVFWKTEKALLKQFCIQSINGHLRPKVVIDYERTAYVEEITNLRITLDENISVSDDLLHFTQGDYVRYPLQEKGEHILEVKFDYILPGYIKHIVTDRNLIQTSFSKYALGRKKLQNMGR